MAEKWSGFPDGTPLLATDILVGLRSGANTRFDASSVLLAANDLSDVGNAVDAFDNISPLTTNGDMIYFNGTHNVRLAIGTNGYAMIATGGIPAWVANPAALKAANLSDVANAATAFNNISPVTTLGDMIYRDGSGNVRLAIGTNGYAMIVTGGIPAWVANPAALKASNLSDLANAATARTNLGVGSASDVTFNSLTVGVANAITAHAGGGQGSATALTKQFNRVTTVATAGDSVVLPAATAGASVFVKNAAASNAMDVFPASGEVINALAADTALSITANKAVIFNCVVAGTWDTIISA